MPVAESPIVDDGGGGADRAVYRFGFVVRNPRWESANRMPSVRLSAGSVVKSFK